MQVKITLYLLISLIVSSCMDPKEDISNISIEHESISHKVDSLMSLMTLEEKVGQMNMYSDFWEATGPLPTEATSKYKFDHLKKGMVGAMLNVHGVEHIKKIQQIAVEESRLGIPLLFGYDVIHGFKTISPIPLAEAASWDLTAIEKSARIAAIEASATGLNWTFAPMVDVTRDARWGRVMEGAGEDPYLGSKIAIARVKGFQGENLSDLNTIAACAKHFAAYGFVESGKEYNSVDIGTSTLYNIILPPFKSAADAGVKTFMNSFNDLNGIPVTASKELQRDLLKGQWNFQGFIVSDWASIKELISWGYAKNESEAAKLAVSAGSDMDMEGYAYINALVDLVKEGGVDEQKINDAVSRILRLKFELGLFDNPYKYCNEAVETEKLGHKTHHTAALDMAKKSIVLLKNETNILPLKKTGQRIALIGPLANDNHSPLGNWRAAAEPNSAVSVLEGMASFKGNSIVYEKGVDLVNGDISFAKEGEINMTDTSQIKTAVKSALNADVVIMVLGEHGFQSGEARSKTNLNLPGLQQKLLKAVYEVNQNIVLVLNSGRPLAIDWAAEHIPSIIMGWQLGSQSGNAIAQVLYGDYVPSAKLPMSIPRSVGQIPIYYNHKNTGRPTNRENNVFWSHYLDSENSPLYPFGFGLSYTEFKYGNLKTNQDKYTVDDIIEISVKVSNIGSFDGKEVVQLYIRDLLASITRPVKELKGFKLVKFKKGETKKVTFNLSKEDLGFYNNTGEFVVEPGEFEIFIGGSSESRLNTTITLK
ncbi:beta-glucosidase BglX [Winogradskyella sp. DF17]|uniref:beta-glucosidase n=1 Tax=Winogradskyella pelagia TaxID=2819984 RepID=A0ABS3SZS3_9FLAO|nr:beta-glucosidase BglX [Winogradskyella sp. DF17]MBO3115166.1 beta-glucosidase BglX [Winogradskyella sp. DF17]